MKRIIQLAVVITAVVGLSACAHTHDVKGPVEKSEIPAGVQVNIGQKEVKEGDKVNVFRSVCRRTGSGRNSSTKCNDVKMGEAVVLKVLDHDSAIVGPQGDLKIDSSMTVEKQ